VVLRLVTTT